MIIDGGIPTVFVSDVDRSIAFYTDVLELKLRERFGNQWALIETRERLIFGLHPASTVGPPSGTVGDQLWPSTTIEYHAVGLPSRAGGDCDDND